MRCLADVEQENLPPQKKRKTLQLAKGDQKKSHSHFCKKNDVEFKPFKTSWGGKGGGELLSFGYADLRCRPNTA